MDAIFTLILFVRVLFSQAKGSRRCRIEKAKQNGKDKLTKSLSMLSFTTLNFTFSVVDTKSEHYTNSKLLHLV